MGTYSYSEFLDTFGGPPERGETYPDDPDALRDQAREDLVSGGIASEPRHGKGSPLESAAPPLTEEYLARVAEAFDVLSRAALAPAPEPKE